MEVSFSGEHSSGLFSHTSFDSGTTIEVLKVLSEWGDNGLKDSFLELFVIKTSVPNIRGALQAPSDDVAVPDATLIIYVTDEPACSIEVGQHLCFIDIFLYSHVVYVLPKAELNERNA